MRILYAASDNLNSVYQLNRFLKYFPWEQHEIKIAGYFGYNYILPIDYNLSFTRDVYTKKQIITNDNCKILSGVLDKKEFDLIITDLDPFISNYGYERQITTWQYSIESIPYFVKSERITKGLYKIFLKSKEIEKLLHLSSDILIPTLLDSFGIEFSIKTIDPILEIGSVKDLAKHNYVASLMTNQRKYISLLKEDSVLFTNKTYEHFNNIKTKSILSSDYADNIASSKYYLCQPINDLLNDGIINHKHINTFLDKENLNYNINLSLFKSIGFINDLSRFKPQENPFIFYHEKKQNIIDKIKNLNL